VQYTIDFLLQTPGAGSPKEFGISALDGVRSWPVADFGDFRIYYLLRWKSILIVRVLHGRRDLQSIFDTSEEEEEPRQP